MKLRDYLIAKERMAQVAERQATVRLRRAAREMIAPVLEKIRYDLEGVEGSIDLLLDKEPIRKVFRWLYVDWAYKQMVWFNRHYKLESKSDLWMRRLEELFETNSGEKITAIMGTTKEKILPTIRNAVSWAADGKSIDVIEGQIVKDVLAEGGAMSNGRARTIARTEVIGASNTATHEAVASSGAKTEKRWVTGGSNIRDTHLAAEAMGWIPFEDMFQVGGVRMKHPSDPNAQGLPQAVAAEVINCKCVEVFRVVD